MSLMTTLLFIYKKKLIIVDHAMKMVVTLWNIDFTMATDLTLPKPE